MLHTDIQAAVADAMFIDASDMRMGKLREHVVFSHEAIDGFLRGGIEPHQLENLQGMLVAAGDVGGQEDERGGAFTEFLDNLVAVDARQILPRIFVFGKRIGLAHVSGLDAACDGIGDFLRLKWFNQEICRAHVHRAPILIALIEAGHKDDIRLADGPVAPQCPRKTETIHARHANIGDNDSGGTGAQLLQGIFATARHRSFMATGSEAARNEFSHHHIVFDHENMCHASILRDA